MNVSSSTSLNPALATMLAQLTPSNGASSPPPAISSDTGSSSPAVGVGTGSGKASVSDAILNLFSQMHQASGAAHHGGGAGGSTSSTGGTTTTASSASTMIDPLSQLMAALSVDEDESAESADTGSDLSMFYPSSNTSSS